mmetsp:Transcript_34984/g.85737  ORF Transcript_34984/g.85737 Transcript_34984/m.85737 type:complete len:233 (+) Transcript_34984:314-1012(+)
MTGALGAALGALGAAAAAAGVLASSDLRPSTALSRSAKILAANSAGWSMLKPEVSMAVSNSSSAVATASAEPDACRALRSRMTGENGLISMVLRPFMYSLARLSPMACAFMMRSMLADHPNLEVTRMHGVSVRRRDTVTFSTLAPSTSFIQSVSTLYSSSISLALALSASSSAPMSRSSLEMSTSFFSLNCDRLVMATSSMGSIKYSTSNPFFLICSRNGDASAASRVSAAT